MAFPPPPRRCPCPWRAIPSLCFIFKHGHLPVGPCPRPQTRHRGFCWLWPGHASGSPGSHRKENKKCWNRRVFWGPLGDFLSGSSGQNPAGSGAGQTGPPRESQGCSWVGGRGPWGLGSQQGWPAASGSLARGAPRHLAGRAGGRRLGAPAMQVWMENSPDTGQRLGHSVSETLPSGAAESRLRGGGGREALACVCVWGVGRGESEEEGQYQLCGSPAACCRDTNTLALPGGQRGCRWVPAGAGSAGARGGGLPGPQHAPPAWGGGAHAASHCPPPGDLTSAESGPPPAPRPAWAVLPRAPAPAVHSKGGGRLGRCRGQDGPWPR